MHRFSPEEVARLLASGRPTRLQAYALQHQHPLNQLTHMVGIPLLLVSAIWLPLAWLAWGRLDWLPWLIAQAVGWFLQLLGHRIEGNRPAFVADPVQMMVGPLVFLFLGPLRRLQGRPVVDLSDLVRSTGGAAAEGAAEGAAAEGAAA
ncbi:MAG: Mpo1-like protein [Planctomycetota bacterium]